MRDRKKQRELHKQGITKEELIEARNYYGINDPTPFLAVKDMIRRQEAAEKLMAV